MRGHCGRRCRPRRAGWHIPLDGCVWGGVPDQKQKSSRGWVAVPERRGRWHPWGVWLWVCGRQWRTLAWGSTSCALESSVPLPSAPALQGLPEGEHAHPSQPAHSKTPQLSQEPKGAQAAGPDPTHHPAASRHVPQMDPHVHLQRGQADTGQTSYPSPVAISGKQELPSPHQAQKQSLFLPTPAGPTAAPGLPLSRADPQVPVKPDSAAPRTAPQRPVDMVQLLTVSLARGGGGGLQQQGRSADRESGCST